MFRPGRGAGGFAPVSAALVLLAGGGLVVATGAGANCLTGATQIAPVENGSAQVWLAQSSPAQISPGPGLARQRLPGPRTVANGPPTVTLHTESAEAFVGETFIVALEIENFTEAATPAFPELQNASVQEMLPPAESTQTLIFNGRMTQTRTRTHRFGVTPTGPGVLEIPAFEVEVDGKTFKTKAVRVKVRTSDASELLSADISAERERMYVGQRVRLKLTIVIKPAVAGNQPLSPRAMFNQIAAHSLGTFATVSFQAEQRQIGGELYYIYTAWQDFIPDRPGRLSFDELEVAMNYPVRFERSPFMLLDPEPVVAGYRRLRVRPEVPEVEVLPLPSAARPANFTGAVGTYNITVAAEPTSVRIGDPIRLSIEIRGDGPIEQLPPPNLAADPGLTAGFRVPSEELAGEVSGSRKRFTQTIRAERADVSEIPPIEYPYFDPDSERYVIARSDPIPLKVAPAAELNTAALAPLESGGPATTGAALRAQDGLRDIETRPELLLVADATVTAPALAAAVAAPPAVFLMAWGYTAYVQRRGTGRRRREVALRTARKQIDEAVGLASPRESADRLAAALTGYLADRTGEPPGKFVGIAAAEYLEGRGVRPETVLHWRRTMERCEQALFGGMTDGDMSTLADEARAGLRAVERERL